MRKTGVAAVTLIAGLTWAGTGLAAPSNVPQIKSLRASPDTFCAKESSGCRHDGTHLRFKLTTDATVRADIRERSANTGPLVEFTKKLHKGSNNVYFHDKRLHTGRWTLRLQGRNSVGSGGIALVDVHIVKHD